VTEILTEVVERPPDGSLSLKQTVTSRQTTLEDDLTGYTLGTVKSAVLRPDGTTVDGSAPTLDAAILRLPSVPVQIGSTWEFSSSSAGDTTRSNCAVEATGILLPGIHDKPCVRLRVSMHTTGGEADLTLAYRCWFDAAEGMLVRYESQGGSEAGNRSELSLIP
jgi:hypothetical protein